MTARQRTFLSLPSPLRLLVALIALTAGIVSGSTVVAAETGVAANPAESADAVEVDAGISPAHVGSNIVLFDDGMSGCCVAPQTPPGDGLLGPGPHAGRSIPGDETRNFSRPQRNEVNEIMDDTGCHRCGTKVPGTKTGDAVPDHQPPLSLSDGPFELYPHCLSCSREQGLAIARLKRLGLIE